MATAKPPTFSARVQRASASRGTASVSTWVVSLSWLIALMAGFAAGVGLFSGGDDDRFAFTSVHGQTVTVYGRGLYRADTLFVGAGNRGTDAVVLAIGIPLLVVSIVVARRGSIRGRLMLAGTLATFLYVYASYALGAAYNALFLVYVAIFAASVFALVCCIVSIDLTALATRLSPRLPRRGVAVFMLVSGIVTLLVWSLPLVGALLRDEPPARLDHYTTGVTNVLDLGIIVPSTFVAAALIRRGAALGYLVAVSLLVLEALLAPLIAAQTASQLAAGVEFTGGEIAGPLVGFVSISVAALWFLASVLRGVAESPRRDDPETAAAGA